MSGWVLLAAFAVATLAGWRLLGAVPSLLHTPLMSGMNALSGITVVAAVAVASSPGDAAGGRSPRRTSTTRLSAWWRACRPTPR